MNKMLLFTFLTGLLGACMLFLFWREHKSVIRQRERH
jgi:hypothetical protein